MDTMASILGDMFEVLFSPNSIILHYRQKMGTTSWKTMLKLRLHYEDDGTTDVECNVRTHHASCTWHAAVKGLHMCTVSPGCHHLLHSPWTWRIMSYSLTPADHRWEHRTCVKELSLQLNWGSPWSSGCLCCWRSWSLPHYLQAEASLR